MAIETKSLEQELKDLKKSYDYLSRKCSYYENGDAKLYYALQRKMSEMANTLNKQNLENIDLDDRNSKAFDRIVTILQKCETISASASALGAIAGVTGDEEKDTSKPGSFLDQIVK